VSNSKIPVDKYLYIPLNGIMLKSPATITFSKQYYF